MAEKVHCDFCDTATGTVRQTYEFPVTIGSQQRVTLQVRVIGIRPGKTFSSEPFDICEPDIRKTLHLLGLTLAQDNFGTTAHRKPTAGTAPATPTPDGGAEKLQDGKAAGSPKSPA